MAYVRLVVDGQSRWVVAPLLFQRRCWYQWQIKKESSRVMRVRCDNFAVSLLPVLLRYSQEKRSFVKQLVRR